MQHPTGIRHRIAPMMAATACGALLASIAIAFGVDLRTLGEAIAPDWYPRLRRILTTGALAALFLSILVA